MGRILGRELTKNALVDHEDRNGLNNRRSNLRLATKVQNKANSRLNKNNSTGYKGVVRDKRSGRFRSKIVIDNKIKYLGIFDTAEEAYEVYKSAAKELWGDFANV